MNMLIWLLAFDSALKFTLNCVLPLKDQMFCCRGRQEDICSHLWPVTNEVVSVNFVHLYANNSKVFMIFYVIMYEGNNIIFTLATDECRCPWIESVIHIYIFYSLCRDVLRIGACSSTLKRLWTSWCNWTKSNFYWREKELINTMKKEPSAMHTTFFLTKH